MKLTPFAEVNTAAFFAVIRISMRYYVTRCILIL